MSGAVGGVLLAGLAAGLAIALPVGAIGSYLLSLSARSGWRIGSAAALGVATADGLYALVAVLAGRVLAGRGTAALIATIAVPLRWSAFLILLVLAGKTIRDGWRSYRGPVAAVAVARPASRPATYLRLLGLTMINPATVVYFAALVAGGRAGASGALGPGLIFAVAAFVASASWQLLLAGGGTVLGRVLSGPRGRLATALVSGVIIAGLAGRTLAG